MIKQNKNDAAAVAEKKRHAVWWLLACMVCAVIITLFFWFRNDLFPSVDADIPIPMLGSETRGRGLSQRFMANTTVQRADGHVIHFIDRPTRITQAMAGEKQHLIIRLGSQFDFSSPVEAYRVLFGAGFFDDCTEETIHLQDVWFYKYSSPTYEVEKTGVFPTENFYLAHCVDTYLTPYVGTYPHDDPVPSFAPGDLVYVAIPPVSIARVESAALLGGEIGELFTVVGFDEDNDGLIEQAGNVGNEGVFDTDGDGIGDGEEILGSSRIPAHTIDWQKPDTDEDGWCDGETTVHDDDGNVVCRGTVVCGGASGLPCDGIACDPAYDSSCVYCSTACTPVTVPGGYCGDGNVDPAHELCDEGQYCADQETPCTQDADCASMTGNEMECKYRGLICSEDCQDMLPNPEPCTLAGNACTQDAECCDGLMCNADNGVCEEMRASDCGNGVIEHDQDEECDDGNRNDGDGCSSVCVVEHGYMCSGTPNACSSAGCKKGKLSGDKKILLINADDGYSSVMGGTPLVMADVDRIMQPIIARLAEESYGMFQVSEYRLYDESVSVNREGSSIEAAFDVIKTIHENHPNTCPFTENSWNLCGEAAYDICVVFGGGTGGVTGGGVIWTGRMGTIVDTLIHEIGHHLRMGHTQFIEPATGRELSYGSPFDVMGDSDSLDLLFSDFWKSVMPSAYSNAQDDWDPWIRADQIIHVSEPGMYEIYAYDSPLSEHKPVSLRFTMPMSTVNHPMFYQIGFPERRFPVTAHYYRQEQNKSLDDAVLIHHPTPLPHTAKILRSTLVDTTPLSRHKPPFMRDSTDAPLKIGHSFVMRETGWVVQPVLRERIDGIDRMTIEVARIGTAVCGDGQRQPGEQCDGGEHCQIDCQCERGYEPSNPWSPSCIPSCGNGIWNSGEECDYRADGRIGTLIPKIDCRMDCQWNPEKFPQCGNGVVDSQEECDGGLHCSSGCKCAWGYKSTDPISVSCEPMHTCGNGVYEFPEECDGGEGCGTDCRCLPFFTIHVPVANENCLPLMSVAPLP